MEEDAATLEDAAHEDSATDDASTSDSGVIVPARSWRASTKLTAIPTGAEVSFDLADDGTGAAAWIEDGHVMLAATSLDDDGFTTGPALDVGASDGFVRVAVADGRAALLHRAGSTLSARMCTRPFASAPTCSSAATVTFSEDPLVATFFNQVALGASATELVLVYATTLNGLAQAKVGAALCDVTDVAGAPSSVTCGATQSIVGVSEARSTVAGSIQVLAGASGAFHIVVGYVDAGYGKWSRHHVLASGQSSSASSFMGASAYRVVRSGAGTVLATFRTTTQSGATVSYRLCPRASTCTAPSLLPQTAIVDASGADVTWTVSIAGQDPVPAIRSETMADGSVTEHLAVAYSAVETPLTSTPNGNRSGFPALVVRGAASITVQGALASSPSIEAPLLVSPFVASNDPAQGLPGRVVVHVDAALHTTVLYGYDPTSVGSASLYARRLGEESALVLACTTAACPPAFPVYGDAEGRIVALRTETDGMHAYVYR